MLDSLTKILEELHFFPMCFTSSTEGKDFIMEQLQTGTLALVISSMMMTGISGMQLMQEVKALREETGVELPFLLMSSFSKGNAKVQEFQIKTSDGSMVDIILKPLVSGVVVRKVRELTEKEFGDEKEKKASPAVARNVKEGSGGVGKDAGKAQKAVKSPTLDRVSSSSGGSPGVGAGATGSSGDRYAPPGSPAKEPKKNKSSPNITEYLPQSASMAIPGSASVESSPKLSAVPGSPSLHNNNSMGESPTRLHRSKTMSQVPPPTHARKHSDPGLDTAASGAIPRSTSVEGGGGRNMEGAFLDTLFSGSSLQTAGKKSQGPDWDELNEGEDQPERSSLKSSSSRRKTIHGMSSLTKKK